MERDDVLARIEEDLRTNNILTPELKKRILERALEILKDKQAQIDRNA